MVHPPLTYPWELTLKLQKDFLDALEKQHLNYHGKNVPNLFF